MLRLIAELKAAGRRVRALKPVASGFDAAQPDGSDTALLLRAQGLDIDAANLDVVSPLSVRGAVVAGHGGGPRAALDFDALVASCRAPATAAP